MTPRFCLDAAIQPTCSATPGRDREHPATVASTTLGRARLAALALALVLGACGGHHTDNYKAATDRQTSCCEHLAGAPRDQCLAEIVRVDDPAVAQASANQRTYACVQRHFTCDPATGRATPESNQAQLDCITDLGE
ncbi:MAG: hypothetical protein IPL61_08710 [Myxococcales bacterium]|nr:hypothetical protein [Myxococcales bacterium]